MKKKKDAITVRSGAAEYLTYVASIGDQPDSIEMRYEDENIWLTQKMMATLYDVDVRTINEHIKKIYFDSELEKDSTIRNFRIVQTEGSRQVTRDTKHYNLQMIIAVGFKVNSERAVQFRKWVNQIAKDYTIKGWAIDNERLKNSGTVLTVEYFDHLLEQIREIRLSERRFYQKITDIYATALDYDRTAKTTKQFFAKVQNKMHYAVHGHTAAELIYERADADKPHMGLTTWAAAPEGKIVKSDVSIAKNYLSEKEMRSLERIVYAYHHYHVGKIIVSLQHEKRSQFVKCDRFFNHNIFEDELAFGRRLLFFLFGKTKFIHALYSSTAVATNSTMATDRGKPRKEGILSWIRLA